MIDASERALLEETVRKAIANANATADGGSAIDAVLAQLGWLEMLDAEPRDAIDIVFSALGAANATASVLDDVVASALDTAPDADVAVLFPSFAAWDRPGQIDRDQLNARGLATARVATASALLVACTRGTDPWIATVPIADVEVTAVHGIDPDAGLRTVRVSGRHRGREAPRGRRVGARRRARAARRLAPDLGSQPRRCSTWRAPTRSSEFSSANRSRVSRRCATDSQKRSWRWRRSRRP